ncbi:carbon catabolite repressor protein 4 [Holotrichia oblita]|uniref:Carbon catabolite repressor protein 4 n=1 Tax=Holotrichia oblita TaxID=644536 RepID=A0ACB9TDN5_HOLOL|nr:carbon catabolite repressor protein 4 [Holotrichia oblita]
MSAKDVKIAYIRSLDRTAQCDFTFWLTVTHPKYGSLNQEIKSVCQIDNNLEFLLNHTRSKISKLWLGDEASDDQVDDLAKEIKISLSRNEQELSGNMACRELIQYKNKIKLQIFGTTYRVVVNAPLIFQLTIPKNMYTNTFAKPQRMKGIHMHKGLSKYKWSKSKDKARWTDIYYEINYNISPEDLGYYLKLTVYPHSKDRTVGPTVEAITENTVEILPDLPTSCVQIEYRNQYTQDKLSGKNLRVVSYNILADRYTDDKFEYCDPRFLSVDYRKQAILKEIINYKADIICMQEVGLEEYKDFFRDQFKNNDYISSFFKKGNMIPEGLAVVFDRNRFKKIDCTHIVFSQEIKRHNIYRDVWNLMKKYKEVKELFLKQHTSLLVTILQLIETGDILVVANTHLYYHCEAGHIRLLQIAMALKYIKQRINHIQSKEKGNVSVIFCGDFNSRPETAVYQLLSCGEINEHEENLDCIGGPKSNIFRHNFKFVSACGTPEYTNYTEDFKGCLDYIFCQSNVKVTQVLPFPAEEDLSTDTALPNKYFPSDHIALVADLKL